MPNMFNDRNVLHKMQKQWTEISTTADTSKMVTYTQNRSLMYPLHSTK